MCHEQGYHPRFIHANTDAVAGHARLGHFKYRASDAVSIANADLVIKKSLNRKIFTELPVDEVITPEKAFPIAIGFLLLNINGPLLPAVTGEIGLGVAVKVELAHHSPSIRLRFPD
jgi:hypothetical protein